MQAFRSRKAKLGEPAQAPLDEPRQGSPALLPEKERDEQGPQRLTMSARSLKRASTSARPRFAMPSVVKSSTQKDAVTVP